MTLKKMNALAGLFTIVLLIVHALYQMIAYIDLYYNPFLSKLFGYLLLALVLLHVILSMGIVFTRTDSKTIAYRKRNIRTIIQRVSALVMVVLLPVHVFEFSLLKNNAQSFLYYLIEATLILFYAALMLHVSTSFGNALVTLGLVQDMEKKKRIDWVVEILCLLFFVAAAVITITVQQKMFRG